VSNAPDGLNKRARPRYELDVQCSGVAMSRQQEDFKTLAKDVEMRAKRNNGICRDVLLSVAETYDAMVRHQQILDDWARGGGADIRR